jgi:hypothetical protein
MRCEAEVVTEGDRLMRVIPILILAVAVPLFVVWLLLWVAGAVEFSLFFTLMMIGLVVIWIGALVDVFRRNDLNVAMKLIWAAVMLFLPFLGTLIYAVTRPPAGEVTYSGETQA